MHPSGLDAEGYAAASGWPRALALGVDAVMVAGWPIVLAGPSFLLLVVSAFWVIPLMLMSIVGTVMMALARRQRNGDRLTPGQLLLGLTVVRGDTSSRVVGSSDAPEPLRPSPARIARARTAFALVATAAAGVWGTAIWVAMIIPRD